jgi:hypothetical protein
MQYELMGNKNGKNTETRINTLDETDKKMLLDFLYEKYNSCSSVSFDIGTYSKGNVKLTSLHFTCGGKKYWLEKGALLTFLRNEFIIPTTLIQRGRYNDLARFVPYEYVLTFVNDVKANKLINEMNNNPFEPNWTRK